MREIKFRAWFKGSPDKPNDKPAFISGFNMVNFHSYYNKGLEPHVYRYDREWKLSDIVLQQFTGLKDKGGRDIYEGDILLYREGEIPSGDDSHHRIFWDEKRAMFWDERLEDGDSLAGYLDGDISWVEETKVIGNIYENPNLIP